MQIKTVPMRVKAGPQDDLAEGEFIVYPSTFTKKPDSYGDVVAKGAFLDDIAAWEKSGNTLPGLYGHRLDDPDFFVASATEMGEDEHGWWVRGNFDLESPKGAQVYRLVKGRRLNQLSFAYDILEAGQIEFEDPDSGEKVYAYELRKLKVYEFSFVPIGANQDTSVVAVKALAVSLRDGVKAGRTLSAKNESALKDARDSIDSVLKSLDGDDGASKDQEKASGTPTAKPDEEPSVAKSGEEPTASPSAHDLAVTTSRLRLAEAEGES